MTPSDYRNVDIEPILSGIAETLYEDIILPRRYQQETDVESIPDWVDLPMIEKHDIKSGVLSLSRIANGVLRERLITQIENLYIKQNTILGDGVIESNEVCESFNKAISEVLKTISGENTKES